MKLNKLHAAIAAATAFASSGAFAAGLNLYGIDTTRAAVTPDIIINTSGATASDNGFKDVMDNLCVAGTLSIYTDRCTSSTDTSATCSSSAPRFPGKDQAAYFCTIDKAKVTGMTANANVLIRKRSKGGSGFGVQPVANATAIDHLALNTTNCKVTATADVYKCGTGVDPLVSDLGVSDVEPAMFVAPNVPAGFSAITSTEVGKLNIKTVAALSFGVPVTNALYAALQQAQGLNPNLDGDGLFEGQSETATEAQILANMPSLTVDQVAALLKGSVVNWSDLYFGGSDLATIASGAGMTVPSNAQVTICRRVDGSGTQATANAMFLNVPCNTFAGFPAIDNTICHAENGAQNLAETDCTSGGAWARYADERGTDPSAPIVFENSGSGDVENCLSDLQGAGRWAMGLQSLEKISTKYSYVKINGVAPTLKETATGNYMDWTATTMQYRKTEPTGNKKRIMDQLRTDFGKPAVLDALNDTFVSHFGPVGFLSTTVAATVPFNANAPVMQVTRGATGQATCNATTASDGILEIKP